MMCTVGHPERSAIIVTPLESTQVAQLVGGEGFLAPIKAHCYTGGGLSVALLLDVDAGRPALKAVSVMPARWFSWSDSPKETHEVLEAREITPSLFREIPLAAILEEAIGTVLIAASNPPGGIGPALTEPNIRRASRPYRRRQELDEGFLRQVAGIVQGDDSGAPRMAVAEQMHTSDRTASRWIAEARRRGFLPPLPKTGKP
jgi:hypothetical protein